MAYKRPTYRLLRRRVEERRRFIQVLAAPRQTGKMTLARQLMEEITSPSHYAAADEPTLKDQVCIEQQWEVARTRIKGVRGKKGVLILDEIQKIPGWSETVKRLWDEDSAQRMWLHEVILGPSPLLMQRGLTERLAGRFEILP